MNHETVERLFAAALDLPREARPALLDAEPDAAVREAVSRLLARHEILETDPHAARFLAGLDLELAARLVENDAADPETIGRFTVIRQLGTGATGVVYLAHDPTLDRDVAIKLLDADLGADPVAASRFAEEARTASGVDHPGVVTVFETGRTDDDRLFTVMAYHDGETLRQRLSRDRLSVDDALRIALEITDGLVSAHAAGVVHCDIKPENILLTARGAKIVDFGIARVAGDAPGRPGSRIGTAAYMSPEQTRGETVDHRSDLWSVGVVLHEMLAGQRPFHAARRDLLLQRIEREPPEPLPDDIDPAVAAIVARCLQKDPRSRFQSAAELLESLRGASAPPVRRTPRRIATLVGVLAVVILAAWRLWPGSGAVPDADAPAPGVVVLPYRTVGPDVAYLGEGMVDLLSFDVDGIAGLRKIDPSTVMTAWRARLADSVTTIDTTLQLAVARQVHARYLVTGSVVQVGSNVRLLAEVRDVATGRLRGTAQVTGAGDSVTALVDRLTLELLRLELLPADRRALPSELRTITTGSLPALKAYLAGEHAFRLARWREAGQHYLRALEHDSTFARALYRLIKANDWGAALGPTEPWLERLAPMVAGLPERDRMLITGEMGIRLWPDSGSDPSRYITVLETLVQRFPDEVEGWVALGDRYYHDRGHLLLPQASYRRPFRTAMALNPYFQEPYLHLLDDAFMELDSAEARRLLDQARIVEAESRWCSHATAFDLVWGSPAARQRALRALDTIPAMDFYRHCLPTTVIPPSSPAVQQRLDAMMQQIADSVLHPVAQAGPFYVLRTRALISRGKPAQLEHELRALQGTPSDTGTWINRVVIGLHLAGYFDSGSAHRAAEALARSEEPGARVWVGLLAVAEQRWTDADREARAIADHADALRAAGRVAESRIAAGFATILREYRTLAADSAADLAALDTIIRLMPSPATDQIRGVVRYLAGVLLMRRGRLDDARRYLESFGAADVLGWRANLELARIALKQGRTAEARDRYRRIATWWRDADPSLQPLVEEARRGMVQ